MNLNIYDLIVKPITTEKSHIQSESLNKYHFEVHVSATKDDIKRSIKKVFNVTPKEVHIMNIKGKVKARKGRLAKLKDTKKAIVTLNSSDKIKINDEE